MEDRKNSQEGVPERDNNVGDQRKKRKHIIGKKSGRRAAKEKEKEAARKKKKERKSRPTDVRKKESSPIGKEKVERSCDFSLSQERKKERKWCGKKESASIG
ncbi:hypothetical protein HanRHA438_Chr12g0564291 [Helianthus annuus]|nr:hypothetical protein HanRHA438_Chr12g0564291 [Helianthus annuus]